jgi:UDP-N-acetylmuramyl pentapeptide synthase
MEFFLYIIGSSPVLYILYSLAIVSPLLNNAALWQQKEWRIDRLHNHFQEVGFFWQLWSKSRVLYVAISYIVLLLAYTTHTFVHIVPHLQIIGLAILTIVQLWKGKQRTPQWTQKAMMTVVLGMILGSIWCIIPITLWPLGIIATPLFIGTAWVLLLPIDYILKQRILQQASALRKTLPSCTVIAITGSVGKTSTKDILAHILRGKNAWVTPKHINTELGLSKWFISKMNAEPKPPDVLVLEMGAYRIGEIALMCRIFKPTIGIITLIGTQHIALFGSQENIWLGKSEIISELLPSEFAILHGDHEYTASAQARTKAQVITVGTKASCTHLISNIQEQALGVSFALQGRTYNTIMHGVHNVYNIAFAIIAAELTGMQAEEIMECIPHISLQEGTFTIETTSQFRIVNDTYNSSPESILAAVQWAAMQPEQNKVLILAGLLEQGVERAAKYAAIAKVAQKVFTQILCFDRTTQAELQSASSIPVHVYSPNIQIPKKSLLVCTGRIPSQCLAAIRK